MRGAPTQVARTAAGWGCGGMGPPYLIDGGEDGDMLAKQHVHFLVVEAVHAEIVPVHASQRVAVRQDHLRGRPPLTCAQSEVQCSAAQCSVV
eukprot:8480118-Pyramimonas_sp.AAC.1